jgi:cell wall-associated NlpC family hydrolase
MIIKHVVLLFLLVLSTNFVSAQNNQNNTNCEESLVTTFTTFFKSQDTTKKVRKEPTRTALFTDYAKKVYNSTMDNVISVGKTFLGIPYHWGGTNERGFDCSGFIKYIFSWFDLNLPRTSREISKFGTNVDRNELQKGDLVFFTGRNMYKGLIGHIGIIVEVSNETVKMMHSSSSQGVHIEDLNKSEYFNKRYITARRLTLEELQIVQSQQQFH